uniref:Ribosomal protein n=1 Tax=Pyxicephalus adspersus TaxID=30357 RepID=A0AAV3ABS1_PYXAD|nr:TPA: hypothetical protein GDO54_012317 [Pyxicephalus adspersus]DBA24694.1 TPA: hypothetical protein GDO54_012317 [Pyxicephalus adspersus]
MTMASLLLRRALFSLSKPLSFVSHNVVHYSTSFNGFMQYTVSKNFQCFRNSNFLTSSHLLPLQQTSGLKTKTTLKKRCKDCFFVKRRGRLYIYCKRHGKHKQRQG